MHCLVCYHNPVVFSWYSSLGRFRHKHPVQDHPSTEDSVHIQMNNPTLNQAASESFMPCILGCTFLDSFELRYKLSTMLRISQIILSSGYLD